MKGLTTILVMIFAVTFPAVVSAEPEFSEKVLLDEGPADSEYSYAYPQMSTGPNSHIYIVWQKDKPGGEGVCFKRSLDGGVSFDKTQELDATSAQDEDIITTTPQIEVDNKGTIYIVFTRYNYEKNHISLILKKSDDHGVHFETQTIYSENLNTDDILRFRQGADLKVTDSAIYYVWKDLHQNHLLRSVDGGTEFEKINIEIDENTNGPLSTEFNGSPALAVDSKENLYITWLGGNTDPEDHSLIYFDMYSVKLEHLQDKFTHYQMVADFDGRGGFNFSPLIVATSTDTIFTFWTDAAGGFTGLLKKQPTYFADSKDGGVSFSKSQEITFGEKETVIVKSTVIDENDAIHFAYLMNPVGASVGDMGIPGGLYYSKSADNCNSFDKGVKVADGMTTADIALNEEEKKVFFVWNQFESMEDGSKHGVYFSRSVEPSDKTEPDENKNTQPASASSGGGGGGGCFIQGMLD